MAIVKENKDCIDYLTFKLCGEEMSNDMNVGYSEFTVEKHELLVFG